MWRAQHFFTLPGDTRPAAEVLSLALQNAEYYQASAAYINDLVYTVYVDMANARLGIVFSARALAYLKSVGRVSAAARHDQLFDLHDAAKAAAQNTTPTQAQVAQALLALPTVLAAAQDKAAAAMAARVSTDDLTASIMNGVVAELVKHIDSQQVFNDVVAGAIAAATTAANIESAGVRAAGAVTSKLFDLLVQRLGLKIDSLTQALARGARVQVLIDGQPLETQL